MLSFLRDGNRRETASGGAAAPAGQPSPALQQMAARLKSLDRPNLLDIGPLCGGNIQFFASQGCRVFVEAAEDLRRMPRPVSAPARKTGGPAAAAAMPEAPATAAAEAHIHFNYPDAHFDGILLWDVADYLVDDRARELGAEMTRLCRPGALLFMYADARKQPAPEPLLRYRLGEGGTVTAETFPGTPLARIFRENRDLFRLFERFEVVKSTLLRNQVREILLSVRA